MHPQLLDLEAAAELIGIAPETARRWAQAGKVPGTRIGGQWRFWAPSVLGAVAGPDAAASSLPPAGHVEPGVVGVAQLAELLGLHQRTLAVLLRTGAVPAQKAGGYQWRAHWPTIRDRIAAGRPLSAVAAPDTDSTSPATSETSDGP